MRIEVTADDIRSGVKTDCRSCPIALALQRTTGQPWEVASEHAEYDLCGNSESRDLPPAVARWIADFDDGKAVAPFTFEF